MILMLFLFVCLFEAVLGHCSISTILDTTKMNEMSEGIYSFTALPPLYADACAVFKASHFFFLQLCCHSSPIPLISPPLQALASNPEHHRLSPSLHLSLCSSRPLFLPAAPDNYSFPFSLLISPSTLSPFCYSVSLLLPLPGPGPNSPVARRQAGSEQERQRQLPHVSASLKQGMEGWWKSSVEGRSPSDMCAQPKGRDRHRPPTDTQTSKQTIMTKFFLTHTCTTCRAQHGKSRVENLLIATQEFMVLKYDRLSFFPNLQQRVRAGQVLYVLAPIKRTNLLLK